jgi:hypothetical protein
MSKQHSHNNTMIKPTSPCSYNNSTGSSMPEPFSVRGKKITREMTKTGHDTTVIKPTLQQHNNPRLDPPCPSVLAQFLQRDEKKLTSINMKVSNLIHNQRTVLASKHYKIGSSAQPVDPLTKYQNYLFILGSVPDYQECDPITTFKALHPSSLLSDCACIPLSE